MKLSYDKHAADPIYYIQKGYRIGKKTTTKTIARIGKHSELLQVTDDPLAYALEQLEQMKKEEERSSLPGQNEPDFTLRVPLSHTCDSHFTPINIGYFYLQSIYRLFDLDTFFRRITADTETDFDCPEINRFNVFDRILFAGPSPHRYFEQPEISCSQRLLFQDFLAEHADAYLDHLQKKSRKFAPSGVACHFDSSFFRQEAECDETSDSCVYMYSPPFPEMNLYTDADGLPVSLDFGTDNLDKPPVRQPGKEVVHCSVSENSSFSFPTERSSIMRLSIPSLSNDLKERLFADTGYRLLSDNRVVSIRQVRTPREVCLNEDTAYKVLSADAWVPVPGQTEKDGNFPASCLLVTFSGKLLQSRRERRNRYITCARECLERADPEEIQNSPEKIARYIRRRSNARPGTTASYDLDAGRIREEERADGFTVYLTNLPIRTNEEDPVVSEVLRIIRMMELGNQAKDFFRMPHTALSSSERSVRTHCLTGYTALLITRLLQKKLNNCDLTLSEILTTLRNMNIVSCGTFYTSLYDRGDVLSALEALTDLQLDRMYYRHKTLSQVLRRIR